MKKQLILNKEFNILSRSIDNAAKCNIVEVCEDNFKIKLQEKCKYEKNESVELFSMTNKGQLYFETIVKDVEDDIISIWYPLSYKYLQRREYSRVQINKEIELENKKINILAQIIDISAGGLKIKTNEQLELLKDYKIIINIENKKIETSFEPIRIETDSNCFITSGHFKNINSDDKILLVQYCFRKQIENNNK